MSPVAFLAPQLAERLKLSDPLLLEMPEQDQTLEPDWLVQLRACCREWEVRGSGDAGGQQVCVVVCLRKHLPPLPRIQGDRYGGSKAVVTQVPFPLACELRDVVSAVGPAASAGAEGLQHLRV